MSVSYRIDRRSGVVLSKATGRVTYEDMLGTIKATINDTRRGSPYRELFDLRDVVEYDIDGDGIKKLVSYVTSRGRLVRFGRVAYVPSKDMVYGIGRIFEAYASDVPLEFMVFGDIDQASSWVGISLPEWSQ
ncbi:MAG: hypothetical protein KAV42_11640 [Candidatus Krumholzibacteria bacterium]|nr:hypothetical protein [Candidatus Krumholzibacteria bacterium]